MRIQIEDPNIHFRAISPGPASKDDCVSIRNRCGKFLNQLLQLCIFRFGLLQDGDVGVSVFPERQEILIGGSYQDFLTLWKDADPDIPVLKQAKSEYAKLQ